MSAGDYSGRVTDTRHDEVGKLGTAFNVMADRVQQSYRDREAKVTELRRTQEQFAQAQRMEAVGRLAGGVAHDFNNLLTVIMGEAELALSGRLAPERAAASLRAINRAAERATTLTRQLLAFSRKQLIEPTVFDLNDLVLDMERMLQRLIGEDVQLIARTLAHSAVVRADRGQVEQVVANLVVNARDAMPRGGRLVLETQNVVLGEEYARSHPDVTAGDYVLLSVTDTGTGMSDAAKAHLFESFFTTKEHGKGTGLGLATSYGIVKQSGGHIAAYSEPGVGTTMKVYLPLVAEHAAPRAAKDVQPPPGGSESILVVEDDGAVRQLTTRMLTTLGYRVLTATDGKEALETLTSQPDTIDLIVTDVVLPGIGGRELAERAAEARPGTRVLFMSGYTDDVILQHQLLARDLSVLQKPFTAEALGRKVREVLDRA